MRTKVLFPSTYSCPLLSKLLPSLAILLFQPNSRSHSDNNDTRPSQPLKPIWWTRSFCFLFAIAIVSCFVCLKVCRQHWAFSNNTSWLWGKLTMWNKSFLTNLNELHFFHKDFFYCLQKNTAPTRLTSVYSYEGLQATENFYKISWML